MEVIEARKRKGKDQSMSYTQGGWKKQMNLIQRTIK